ncbi:MAG: ArsR/SmtB family transcription factor [Promethearchaeota archaeon]
MPGKKRAESRSGSRAGSQSDGRAESCTAGEPRILPFGEEFIRQQVEVFKVLSDPIRLQLIYLLEQGPMCVCEIEPHFDRSQAAISKHLKVLLNAGILSQTPEGTRNVYSLIDPDILSVVNQTQAWILKKVEEREARLRNLKDQAANPAK